MNELTDQEVDAMFSPADNQALAALRIKPINRNDEYRRDYERENFGAFVGLGNVVKFYAACGLIFGTVYAIRWAWRAL